MLKSIISTLRKAASNILRIRGPHLQTTEPLVCGGVKDLLVPKLPASSPGVPPSRRKRKRKFRRGYKHVAELNQERLSQKLRRAEQHYPGKDTPPDTGSMDDFHDLFMRCKQASRERIRAANEKRARKNERNQDNRTCTVAGLTEHASVRIGKCRVYLVLSEARLQKRMDKLS